MNFRFKRYGTVKEMRYTKYARARYCSVHYRYGVKFGRTALNVFLIIFLNYLLNLDIIDNYESLSIMHSVLSIFNLLADNLALDFEGLAQNIDVSK